jgi:hypothetical protein
MEDLRQLFNKFLSTPFPDVRGEVIRGIELVMLDSTVAGLLMTYFSSRGYITDGNLKMLRECYEDLEIVHKELSGANRQYFATLQNITAQVIANADNGKRSRQNHETLHRTWKPGFDKIRKILNDWDPLRVTDVVDDEYDTMNFRALSVLINGGQKGDIKRVLKEYLNNDMEIDESDDVLNDVTNAIWNEKDHLHSA